MKKEPGYPIPLTPGEGFVDHVQWSGDNPMLSPPECREIISIGEASGRLTKAYVGNPDESRIDETIRLVDACSLSQAEVPWLYERIAERVRLANDKYYKFDLVGLMEPVQLLRYKGNVESKENGHYGWHQDYGNDYMANRKLSLVIQLSNPEDYKGGQFHWMTHVEWESRYTNIGDAMMFPSWTPHRVLPITEGTRYALAVWIHGPRLR
jgi:PKHD-type hydroxylase